MVEGAKDAFTGIAGNELGATGLFTGMIIGILSVELFCFFEKQDALKCLIKFHQVYLVHSKF